MEPPEILKSKYPAKNHCAKVVTYLKSKHDVSNNSIIYLEGQGTHLQEDNDEAAPFRYEDSMSTLQCWLKLQQPATLFLLPQRLCAP